MRRPSAAVRCWECFCFLLAVVIAPAIGRGDTITTQVTCSMAGQTGVVASSSCSQMSGGIAVQESIQTSIAKPNSSSDYFTFSLTDAGIAQAQLFGPDSLATSSANVDISLRSLGLERSGYIEILPFVNGGTEYALNNLSFSIGGLAGSCDTRQSNCYMSTPGVNYPDFPRLYAFTLGDPFSLDVSYSSILDALYEDGTAETNLTFDLRFRLLEVDGVTPVALNPEPSTWALAGTGLMVALLLGRRKTANRTAR